MARGIGGLAVALLAAILATTSVSPASAQIARPRATSDRGATSDLVTSVQYRRFGGGRWHGGPGAGIGLGIAGAAILGGIIASQSQPYYYGPYGYPAYPVQPYYGVPGDAVGYCLSRFRSYDPASGTYLGFDGYWHPCP